MTFSVRKRAILSGLYLSKFDQKGLIALGLSSFTEAFNILAYALGTKPATIKNYRDEFDPYFPNQRKGWHKRKFREYCKEVYNEFSDLDFNTFQKLIKSFAIKNFDVKEIVDEVDESEDYSAFAKRQLTGNAAESYFSKNYLNLPEFASYSLKDTTSFGCGFDFKLSNNSDFYLIEVKGISKVNGSILLTEKEYSVAQRYSEKFCLFVVKNFADKPFHEYVFNPLESHLKFDKTEREIKLVNYTSFL